MKDPTPIIAALAVALSFAPSAEAGLLKNLQKVAKASRQFNTNMLLNVPRAAKNNGLKEGVRQVGEHSKDVNKFLLKCAIDPRHTDGSWTCPK
jgi:hypothetical protein